MPQLRPNLQQTLWEIPAIVLAIFLALAVDNCNENRKEKALAQKALEAIVLEIQGNRAELESNLADNELKRKQMQATRDSLIALGEGGNVSVSIGYNQILMSNGAWEMAKLSGAIRRFEPRTIQNLSELYHLQDMYINLGNEYFRQLASIGFHQSRAELPRLDASLNLIKMADSVGKSAMKGYDAFLEDHREIAARLEKNSKK
ncbi:MAG: hypothetical protein H6559_19485 [Lewinellaceae bacterium]|nr:hypothetical protein [Lewinellaceae bacterium]